MLTIYFFSMTRSFMIAYCY